MKLTLINFRCHLNKTFNFGNKGLVLISGQSGNGKSTIMIAISFALFGKGNKLISYGKKSCKVILEFNDLKIERSKKPNRLIVNNMYEDEAGQHIINEIFGETYDVTGYMAQNGINSFILMSPLEKMIFLEKFVFKDINLYQIKNKCKEEINESLKSLNHTKSQLEMANNVLSEIKKPIVLKFPIKYKSKNITEIKEKLNIKNRNCDIKLKKYKKKISLLEEELNKSILLENVLKINEEHIENIQKKINKISEKKGKIKFIGIFELEILEEKLKKFLNLKKYMKLNEDLNSNIQKLEEIREIEKLEIKQEIENIDNTIWKEYNEDEIKENINDYNCMLEDVKKKKKMNKIIENTKILDIDSIIIEINNKKIILEEKKEIKNKLKIQLETYICPMCNSRLKLNGDVLELTNCDKEILNDNIPKLEKEIEEIISEVTEYEEKLNNEKNKKIKVVESKKNIENIINQYDDILPDIQEIEENLNYLNEYYLNQKYLRKKRKKMVNKLENKIFSPICMSYEKNIEQLKNTLSIIKQEIDVNNIENLKLEETDEEKLRNDIQINKDNNERIKNFNKEILELNEEKNQMLNQQEKLKKDHIEKYTEIKNIDVIRQSITEYKCILEKEEHLKIDTYEKIESVKKWEYNEEIKINYEKWKNKIKDLKKEEKEKSLKYSSVELLKEKILQAESIAVLKIIDSINSHAHIFLESFFPENPISVRLVPFKKMKNKVKSQINLEIEYKGMEIELNMLSGGELSRIILAFTLALGEMFNTKLILLDESTASLDQELTSLVFNGIKENFNEKLILIIAHQVISGTFDKKIELL